MSAARRSPSSWPRRAFLLAAFLALALQLMFPPGFMAAAPGQTHGLPIVICSAEGPTVVDWDQVAPDSGARKSKAPAKSNMACPFAGHAVALLTLASAQSVVMQAREALPWAAWPICSVESGSRSQRAPAGKTPHQVCSICAAASCPPIGAAGPSLRPPAAIAWSPWRAARALGPRGPPAFRPKARGPPSSPLTV